MPLFDVNNRFQFLCRCQVLPAASASALAAATAVNLETATEALEYMVLRRGWETKWVPSSNTLDDVIQQQLLLRKQREQVTATGNSNMVSPFVASVNNAETS